MHPSAIDHKPCRLCMVTVAGHKGNILKAGTQSAARLRCRNAGRTYAKPASALRPERSSEAREAIGPVPLIETEMYLWAASRNGSKRHHE